ncbi:hypothetical protein [Arthrobacter sp. L77]|uniref:hypothetical protein n=1 Tax=Arthrobacter sp. L77 TaxID=1496689 RepID=UPI0005BC921E|nr:hypothetical protein [Arthrobacter sp. L77]
MTSEHPSQARVVDLDSIADTLGSTIVAHPGVVRLEPTVRSVMTRWKVASVNQLHRTLRSDTASPTVATRDGLVLSLTDGVLDIHIDVATNIARPALGLAREVQDIAAHLIQSSGLTVGRVDVTILAIEGTPET